MPSDSLNLSLLLPKHTSVSSKIFCRDWKSSFQQEALETEKKIN